MSGSEGEQIRELYATYGLAMYEAQCVEKELALLILTRKDPERFTRWDYDDQLAGHLESTFGALVKTFRRRGWRDKAR
jgi:hypothetical protein